jgi:hypothetical protein
VPDGEQLSLLCELSFRGQTVPEAVKRSEERVDLEQGVLAQLRRLERELEVDRVGAASSRE